MFRNPIGKDFDRQCTITRAEIQDGGKVVYIIKCGTVGLGWSMVAHLRRVNIDRYTRYIARRSAIHCNCSTVPRRLSLYSATDSVWITWNFYPHLVWCIKSRIIRPQATATETPRGDHKCFEQVFEMFIWESCSQGAWIDMGVCHGPRPAGT